MDIELVKQLEAANDGQTIHLFYDDMVGLYLAFGQSAYYTAMVVTPYVSFSNALQMPVALLRRGHVNALRQAMQKLEHTRKSYYQFRLRQRVGDAGYERWLTHSLEKMEL
jgi:hypothetical protein